ncbi:GNAT family N-acetyltransferase [Amycolatopsis magusensis]|uniref:GNAT family N-acetyltransferase n=1 Tax=Amycolatopsis magusensis TaxID=882444 RepID=UPI0024A920A0|nr:GNAT family N-acetyltransferase [Amycolatopsis magusensis]MDI5974817.1 GNAT family N-acetyltransferase [Amycolatopsis magusensis]
MDRSEVTRRPLTLSDVTALADLFATAEAVDPTGEHESAEDIAESITSPNVDLEHGSLSWWAGDQLIAYALVRVRDGADPVHQLRFEATVHPEHRTDELGAQVLAWVERAGRERHLKVFPDAPLELHGHGHENQRWYSGQLEMAGYHRARDFFDMRADLGALPPKRELPSEFALVTYEDKYFDAVLTARNITFAEHWGSTVQSPEAWRHLVTDSASFRPELSFLLLRGDEVVSLVLSDFYESDAKATGVRELYISHVATLPELRGRGVASALLGHTLEEARAAGYERASLGVDAENANAAVGIYERCGFAISSRWYGYVRAVDATLGS